MVSNYEGYYDSGIKPTLPDRGVSTHDVLAGTTVEEFNDFYERVQQAAKIAREAFDETEISKSTSKWREILGNKFPEPPSSEGFTQRESISTLSRERFS
jgi:transposase